MTQQQAAGKPLPLVDDLWRPFFEAARRGTLLIMRCRACNAFLHPGSELCAECWSQDLAWVPASGAGTLFTFAVMHQRYHPAFHGEIPYNLAIVELDEGPRLHTNIVGVRNEDLCVGMRVQVTFERMSDEVTLPKFRPEDAPPR